MKLNWFSPLPPARTEIANHTMRTLPALCSLADVTVWTEQKAWDQQLAKVAEVRSFKPGRLPWDDLNRADISIYNLGNNPLFHVAAWQTSRQHPGVVVLHDFRMHHFFDAIYRVKSLDREAYLAVMERYYGQQGRQDGADCYSTDARNIQYMAEHYPLTSLAVEKALGVMVHNENSFEILSKELLCPLSYASLPFGVSGESRQATISRDRKADLPFKLVLFGYIAPNRRLNSVLTALAGLPEKDKFHLDVIGDILDDEKQALTQIRRLNLENHVTVRGFVSDGELDNLLVKSDLAINLRFPTMGEASASQLRIWSHALPSLVTRVGWYASVEADSVAFVRPDEYEIEDIQQHLRALVSDPGKFARMGAKGRRILEEHHQPDDYARALMAIAEAALAFRSRSAYLSLAERSAQQAGQWLGPGSAEQTYRRVADEILAMGGC